MLDKIKVDYYGTPTPLQQVGNISVPEARIIQIQPWKKADQRSRRRIMTSDLGINPTMMVLYPTDLPGADEERRKSTCQRCERKKATRQRLHP